MALGSCLVGAGDADEEEHQDGHSEGQCHTEQHQHLCVFFERFSTKNRRGLCTQLWPYLGFDVAVAANSPQIFKGPP